MAKSARNQTKKSASSADDTLQGKTKQSAGNVHEMPGRSSSQEPLREPEPPYPKQHQPRPGIESQMQPRPRYEGPAYKPANKLLDRVALITGGDSGIGRSVAVLFAREGADVAIVHLPEEAIDAEETRDAVEEAGRRCLLIAGDVTDPQFCDSAVEQVVDEFGKLDILVNNAAFQQHAKDVEEVTDEIWDHTFKANIYGYFRMARAALRHMKEGASIINTGSITGLEGNRQLLAYASTKGAIHAFTKSLAQLLIERKIRVNCVAPGPVWTPLNVADKEAEQVAEHGQKTPMKRAAQPEEIAPAYVFFASEGDSSYITGEVVTLLGGGTTAA